MLAVEEELKEVLSDFSPRVADVITRYIDLAIDERADIRATCSGRLTLLTATPVTTADQTGKGTIYFAPYKGSKVSLYDGTNWKLYSFTEVNLALTVTSGKNYDVFLYDSSGTLTLTLSDAWTNDTAREDALGTLNGVYVNSVTLTLGTVVPNTGRYLGTIRASAANATEDSVTKRFLWNYYNRVTKHMKVINSTDTYNWTYTTATWQAAVNNAAGNALKYVAGIDEEMVTAIVKVYTVTNSSDAGYGVGVGVDSVTVNSAILNGDAVKAVTYTSPSAFYSGFPGIGYHYLQWLEYSQVFGTTTWYGHDNATPRVSHSGIMGHSRF